jgi:orotidine 5'-phosphate decarboxylase subfamily 2
MKAFGARLRHAMDTRGPLCVGIDPHPDLMSRWGLPFDVEGLSRFSQTMVDAVADRVAVVKPQSAFYERFGSRGIAVLESTIRQLRDAGTLVLLDVKRGDIDSTMAAYAGAYLDPSSPIYVDAITVSPFLGYGSLRPVMDVAAEHGGGVFVLALTSNPEGASVQRAVGSDGRTVAQHIIDEISQVNRGVSPIGSVGIVVGATIGETGHSFTSLNGPMLAPGVGFQGARAADLRRVFGADLSGVLPSVSREILNAGPAVTDLRAAIDRARDECLNVISTEG